ncbi:MAG: glucose-6-phosphate dehydrogenase [Bacteroidota bacterium]
MEPLIAVIFGASGDLTERKLIPAIYELFKDNLLPDCFAVLGVSRSEYSDEEFRKKVFFESEFIEKGDEISEEKMQEFASKLYYISIDTSNQENYGKVKEKLKGLDQSCSTQGNYMFYLSTPPFLYEIIPENLAAHGLNKEDDGWKRLVIEKPFGHDEESAKALNKELLQYFDEERIYRIDHYLGKETVQNLLVTRFANGIFEPLWNRNYIERVEITAAEKVGVKGRAGYYDSYGALRDMVQNHLLQVLAHVAMEAPNFADANAIRTEKVKLFQSIRPIKKSEVSDYVIRGQYIASDMNGEQVEGYRDHEDVPNDSKTETYVALKFFVDNWRWADVPFYIRTGKFLPTKVTEVVITFKSPPHPLFKREREFHDLNNQLIIRIQPDEGIALQFGMKVPGQGFKVKNVDMEFHYSELVDAHVPQAYERLLLDCMKGDATLYAHGESVEAAWRFVDPIIEAWKEDDSITVYGYPAGTWGPDVADDMIDGENETWHNPYKSLTTNDNFCVL